MCLTLLKSYFCRFCFSHKPILWIALMWLVVWSPALLSEVSAAEPGRLLSRTADSRTTEAEKEKIKQVNPALLDHSTLQPKHTAPPCPRTTVYYFINHTFLISIYILTFIHLIEVLQHTNRHITWTMTWERIQDMKASQHGRTLTSHCHFTFFPPMTFTWSAKQAPSDWTGSGGHCGQWCIVTE